MSLRSVAAELESMDPAAAGERLVALGPERAGDVVALLGRRAAAIVGRLSLEQIAAISTPELPLPEVAGVGPVMVSRSLRLPPELDEQIGVEAGARKVNWSDVVREALVEHFARRAGLAPN